MKGLTSLEDSAGENLLQNASMGEETEALLRSGVKEVVDYDRR